MPIRTASPPFSCDASAVPRPAASPHVVGALSEMRTREFGLCVATLMVLTFLVNAAPVPFGTEDVYLLAPYKTWHPEFLPNDWTFATPRAEHSVFNWIIGAFTMVLPLEVIGWVGRIVTWALLLVGLLKLGRRFAIPYSAATLGIALWILMDQSIVAVSTMLTTFEAKSLAYVFLLFAIDRLLDDRDRSGALMLGLSFSFHPAVGLLAIPAVGVGLVALRYPGKRLAVIVGLTFLGALPGVIPLATAVGVAPSSRAMWEYLVRVQFSMHLDPLIWIRREFLQLILVSAFSLLHWLGNRESRAVKFLAWFQITLAGFFAFGLLSRVMGWYELLQITPFRLFPMFAPLLFFFAAAHAYRERKKLKWQPVMIVLGGVCLMGFTSPIGYLWDRAAQRLGAWRADDLRRTFVWISQNTPLDAVTILPPWRRDSFYFAQRAQVANHDQVRLDRFAEWRERVESLVGPLPNDDPSAAQFAVLERRYNTLTEPQIARVASTYGASYLVSRVPYAFPITYQSGNYRVYRLTPFDSVGGR
ncbi:MAG: hypothetical protein ACT4PJ_01085 [Gemmatimonadaceae bacterium]